MVEVLNNGGRWKVMDQSRLTGKWKEDEDGTIWVEYQWRWLTYDHVPVYRQVMGQLYWQKTVAVERYEVDEPSWVHEKHIRFTTIHGG